MININNTNDNEYHEFERFADVLFVKFAVISVIR